jgi:hypothetical protein
MATSVPDPGSWRTSTKSETAGCVQVAAAHRSVFIRDSHDLTGPVLVITGRQWAMLVKELKERSFDSSR